MLKLWRSKKEKESGARSAIAGDGLSGDPSLVPIERPGRRHPPGDLHPSPQPSPIPGQAAASQKKHTEHQQEPPPAPTSQASSKERTPTKATAEWRRNQAKLEALRAAHGQHDYDAMSPIFEIKQTVDVEAEHAEQEAALKALREKPPPPAEENVEKDEFVKKKGGFMARFLARKTKSDADVDGAIAAAEAQENANQKSADGADGAAAAGTNAGEAAAGANASAANELSKGTTVAAEKPTPSKASDAGAETGDTDDLYPPPPPEEDEHESELEALNKKDQKHDPSKERRRVAFDVNARSYSRWKGLGLHDAVEENSTVQLRRAADVSADTKTAAKKAQVSQGVVTVSRIGALHITVIEAKGVPKIDHDGGSDVFVATRLFPTELTSKPESEKETTKIYEKDSLSRSLKIRWLAEFEIDVRSKEAWLECEVCIVESSSNVFGIGRLRMPVQEIIDQSATGDLIDAWYPLKRDNGAATSAALHISMRYEDQELDPKQLLIQARAQREALMADALPDIPDWISAWDVRCVRKFGEEIKAARKKVNEALDEDSLELLREGLKLINDYSLVDEANSRELKERLLTLEEEEKAQLAVKKKIRALLAEPRTRVFYLKSAIAQLLNEAHMCNLTNTCAEVKAGLELVKWCSEAAKNPAGQTAEAKK